MVILFGLTMLDFPTKRRMERWLLGRPAVLRGHQSVSATLCQATNYPKSRILSQLPGPWV